AVRFGDELAKLLQVLRREADDIEIQVAELFVDLLFVENTYDAVFTVHRRHNRYAEVDLATAQHDAEAAVLRHAALGDVEFRHDLDALNDRLVVGNVNR